MAQMLFEEYLKGEISKKGLSCYDFYSNVGLKEKVFNEIINGYFIITNKKTIKRMSNVLGLNFLDVYSVAMECKNNRNGIFLRGEKTEPRILADELKKFRIVTLEQMAIKTGCSVSCLMDIESGKMAIPTEIILKKLSKGYGIPFGYILNYSKGFGVV